MKETSAIFNSRYLVLVVNNCVALIEKFQTSLETNVTIYFIYLFDLELSTKYRSILKWLMRSWKRSRQM